MLMTFLRCVCYGQDIGDISIDSLMEKIELYTSIDTAKIKTEKCKNFSFQLYDCCRDDRKSDNFYLLKKNIVNDSLVKIEWHLNGTGQKLIFTPQHIDNWVMFGMFLYEDHFLVKNINGFLVINKLNGDSYFVGVNSSLPIPLPDGSINYEMDINSILLLDNSLRPISGYRVYGNSIVGRSDFTYDKYIITEEFCLIPPSYYYAKSLTTDNFTFEMIKTSLSKNSDCLFKKDIIHQCKPGIPLWIQ